MARGTVALLCLIASTWSSALATGAEAEIFPKLRRGHRNVVPKALPLTGHGFAKVKGAPAAVRDALQAVAEQEPAETAEGVLPDIPEPVDVGPSGNPELPVVDTMLSNATLMMQHVDTQYAELKARLEAKQKESGTKMNKQKVVFEQKLKAQEEGNRVVVAESTKIKEEIEGLKKGNDALRTKSKELQQDNHEMRTELHALQEELGTAHDFAVTSLKSTDDSKAKDLVVLEISRSKPHRRHVFVQVEHDDDEEDNDRDDDKDDDEDDAGVSLFQDDAEVEPEDPEAAQAQAPLEAPSADKDPSDILNALSKGVDRFEQEEQAQEERIKALFRRDYQLGARRHAALKAHEGALNSTRTSLSVLQSKLHTAEDHLERTKADLQQRLHGLGHFLQHLGHLALAPTTEVPQLLTALPSSVEAAVEKKPEEGEAK